MDLVTRWRRLCFDIGKVENPEIFLKELWERYSEPHRKYHTLRHIEQGLLELDNVKPLVNKPEYWAILAAWWLHDIVYKTEQPAASFNEEKSAEFAFDFLKRKVGINSTFAYVVFQLIMATNHNVISSPSTASQILIDVDLSIFGQPPEVFGLYEIQIREEYIRVPEEEFKINRAALLEKFLRRKRIYHTDFFNDKYEERARENLERSLHKLRS